MDRGPKVSKQEFAENGEEIRRRIIDGGPYTTYGGDFIPTTELIAQCIFLEKEARAAQLLAEAADIEIDLAA